MNKYHLKNHPTRELKEQDDIYKILKKGKYTTISMCRDNEPYIVTLSYGFDVNKKSLYFHCAPKGLKLDFINDNSLVCATVIEDGGYIMDECAHEYKSVVFWGKMSIVTEISEKKHAMTILLNHLENKQDVIKKNMLQSDSFYSKKMVMLRLDINQIHGKAGH